MCEVRLSKILNGNMNRRDFILGCSAFGSTTLAGCIGGEWASNTEDISLIETGPEIDLTLVAEGVGRPSAIVFPDGDLRYIADLTGQILIHDRDGLANEPLIDFRESQRLVEDMEGEKGIVGLELHPNFAQNRKLYVRYSAPLREAMPKNFSHTFVLSEFQVSEDLRSVVPDSERCILEIAEPGINHNAGAIEFGPEGYLYVSVGDGFSTRTTQFSGFRDAGPGHPNDWYLINKGGNGQDVTENLHGSILRINVDETENGNQYSIPDDNPLVGTEGLDEHYAWGFRNPFRMSFDGERLFVGDVGLASFEEINIVRKGGNYGWNVKEGYSCLNANQNLVKLGHLAGPFVDSNKLPFCPSTTPEGDPLIEPVISYPHRHRGRQIGVAVVGGYVYRNSRISALEDKYVFADFLGKVYMSDPHSSEKPWPIAEVKVSNTDSGRIEKPIFSLGRDRDGELYVLTRRLTDSTGAVYMISQ